MTMDVHQRDDLPFPHSLPEFQRFFPDVAACAAYLEKLRWPGGPVAFEYCLIVFLSFDEQYPYPLVQYLEKDSAA